MKKALGFSMVGLLLMAGGCATTRCCCPDCSTCVCSTCNPTGKGGRLSEPGGFSAARDSAPRVYTVAPAQFAQQLKDAVEQLGFTVTQAQSGQIQTDWREYEGEFHIARRWQERTRFDLRVIPDVDNPTGAARFEISEETERRSNARANWEPASRRPDRARELAQQIHAQLARK